MSLQFQRVCRARGDKNEERARVGIGAAYSATTKRER